MNRSIELAASLAAKTHERAVQFEGEGPGLEAHRTPALTPRRGAAVIFDC